MDNWQKEFIIAKLKDKLSRSNTFFNYPDCMCFTYGVSEIINICEIKEKTGNSYFELLSSFYDYLKTDFVLKNMDESLYINLLKNTKDLVEGNNSINTKKCKYYYKTIYTINHAKYKDNLMQEIIEVINGKDIKEKQLDVLIDLYINELISAGYTLYYLEYMIKYYLPGVSNVFDSLISFMEFLINTKSDNYDIYIPIHNAYQRDIKYVGEHFSSQKINKGSELIEEIDNQNFEKDKYYCHVYFKNNDFVRGIEDHVNRINSIFNILKFYTDSQISVDMESNIIIKSKRLVDMTEKTFSIKKIMQYHIHKGNNVVISLSNKNFERLKKNNSDLLLDLYDIMNYSQKNNDIYSNEQFLNKWIALETIASKSCENGNYEILKKYLPKCLVLAFYRKNINRHIKKSKLKLNLEDLIKDCDSDKLDSKINKISNPYLKYKLKKYKEVLSDPKRVIESIDSSRLKFTYQLERIYMLRNQYVHDGNTNNMNDIFRYYINVIEPFYIDKIIHAINNILGKDRKTDIYWDDIYNSLNFKYDMLNTYMEFLRKDIKFGDTKCEICKKYSSEQLKNYITNILLERTSQMDVINNNINWKEIDDDDYRE